MQNIRLVMRYLAYPKQGRSISQYFALRQSLESQAAVTENLTIPLPTSVDKPPSQKIEKIFSDISKLNLLEVSELNDLLKKRLNLPDAPSFAVGAITQPTEVEEAAPQSIKSSFTVKLMKFDEKQKVPLIKEIKNLVEGMNLVQAKKFVESAPAVVRADIGKEEADKLKEAIEKVGGTVTID